MAIKNTRKNIKNLLFLCIKNIHFTFENNIYQEKDDVAMESPLRPVLAETFMVHSKRTLMPKLEKFMKFWKRYVDDTIPYIKLDFITYVNDILNKFHENIKFTDEVECNDIRSFLDVLLMRNNGKSETTAFRKETNNNIYLHWRSFAPITWKKGTLRTLFRSTYTVYSNNNLLQEKLQHIEKYFTEINGYPKSLLKQTLDSFKTSSKEYNNKINNKNNNDINVNNLSDKIVHNLMLPYQGDHDTNSKNSIKLSTKKSLPENLDVRII